MQTKALGNVLIGLSVAAVLLSAVGALGYDIWLASTQWAIIAAVLAIYAIYTRLASK